MRSAAALAFVLALSGCVSVQPVSRSTTGPEETVNQRNYSLGVEQVAALGDPVLRLKSYRVRPVVSSTYTVNESCRVHLAMRYTHVFSPGDAVPLLGDSPCDEGTCRLIRLDNSPLQGDLGALILPDGQLGSRPINLALGNKQLGKIRVEPASCRFVPMGPETRTALPESGYRNFEILYGGTEDLRMRFTYREYSFDDLARPAFSQSFVYPIDAREVRFKNIVIQVAEARPDTIRYTVLDDGTQP